MPGSKGGTTPPTAFAATEVRASEQGQGKGIMVLVVDDDPEILNLLQTTLSTPGDDPSFEVRVAPDARTAMALFRRSASDVVISDQAMPGQDGITFLSEIKDRSPETILLLITATSTVDTVLWAANLAQIDGYVEKPLDPRDIRRRILEALLRRREREHSLRIGPQHIEESLDAVREMEGQTAPTSLSTGPRMRTFAFESALDFNHFTFVIFQSSKSRVSDAYVHEGRFYVTVGPKTAPAAGDPAAPTEEAVAAAGRE